jgi:transaldolase
MKIFLDTANLASIKKFVEMGVVDGITTNPTLIAKENVEFSELVAQILKLVPGPVNLEVVSQETEGMVREGHDLASLSPNVVVKCPMTSQGLKAVRELHKKGIRTNVTLIFSANQAILAAKAGADYASPFIGRLDDAGHDGMMLIDEILRIYHNYDFNTQVLVASIRHPVHVVEAAKLGAHVATMPPEVLDKMVKHPLTDIGLKRFLDDWQKAGLNLREVTKSETRSKPLIQRA